MVIKYCTLLFYMTFVNLRCICNVNLHHNCIKSGKYYIDLQIMVNIVHILQIYSIFAAFCMSTM